MTLQERLVPGRYRLTVEDYTRLEESGAFGDARSELVGGDVILMSPQYRPHGMVKLALYDALRDALRVANLPFTAVVEFSLAIDEHNMPEPDIMLTSEPSGDGPVPLASVALVIEVSDTTLDTDLGTKARLYATAGVPEYWVADVNGKVIHQMWAPKDDVYIKRCEIIFEEKITSIIVERLSVVTAT